MGRDRIVAVGLLTQADLDMLGSGFRRAYPVEQDAPPFGDLLRAIDEADRHYRAGHPGVQTGAPIAEL